MAKSHRFTRVGRLVGACAVVGALLAGPLAGAGNAVAAPDLSSFAGQGTGFALRVVVDLSGLPSAVKGPISTAYGTFRSALPSAQQALLPASFPFTIDQRFIETLSQLGSTTQAHALLGQGTLQNVLGASFNKSANATKVGDHSQVDATPTGIPGVSLPLLNLGIGKLTAAIPSATQVLSDGSLVSVSASLQNLLSALPGLPANITNELTAAFGQLQTQLQGVVNSAFSTSGTTGALAGALGTVGTTLASTPATSALGGVLQTAGVNPASLGGADPTKVISDLLSGIAVPQVGSLLNGALATVNGVANKASAQKLTGKSFSDASSSLASIDVLGLLHVGAVNLASHSEAGGKPGTAHNTSSCSLVTARLGAAGISLDGKTIVVNGIPVPVPAIDLGVVQGAVNSVLSAAGLSVGLCDVANGHTAADGTSASQTMSALRIQFAPTLLSAANGINSGNDTLGLLGTTPVKIIIDPSVETAASAQVAAVAPASNPVLPHTGAAPLATVVTGLMVAGGALFLRRRLAA